MAMLRKAVSTLLLMLMALLSAGAMAITAIQLLGPCGRYGDSLEAARLAAADNAIFQGVLALRLHRGASQSALLGLDDPRARLAELEKLEQAGYESIIAALDSIEFARRDEIASELK